MVILFAVLHVAELAAIGYLIYQKRTRVPQGANHGHCTICGHKVAKWARPGVCVNCK
jgi:hypothetical protein